MKTYKIELSSEPLREGCLTQHGVVTEKFDEEYTVNDFESFNEMDLKHLKCIEVEYFYPDIAKSKEITHPADLQKIWEAIRGEEPEIRLNNEVPDQYDRYAWQNFTLKEGTYEVDVDDILKQK